MAKKPKLSDLLKGTTGSPVAAEPAAVSSPVVPGSPLPAVIDTPAKAAGGAPIRQRRVPTEAEVRAQARRLIVRAFVRHYLRMGADTFMNAAECYRRVNPECPSAEAAHQGGYRMIQDADVKEETQRQLRAIDKAADLDDQWVYDRWRAIANANIFDYMSVDAHGIADFTKLDPDKLTPEQQLCIEEVHLDKSGRITKVKLASKNQAVANVARARQMIDGKRDLAAVDLAKTITERMNKAAARIGRVFEHDTGEQV